MPTDREIQARERMAEGFFPIEATVEHRAVAAQEYSAFYLGEIAKHLESLSTSVLSLEKTLQAISSKIAR